MPENLLAAKDSGIHNLEPGLKNRAIPKRQEIPSSSVLVITATTLKNRAIPKRQEISRI